MDKMNMLEQPFEKFAELHKEMWMWLSENPDKEKLDWPGWENVELCKDEVSAFLDCTRCFACTWDKINNKTDLLPKGDYCPINKGLTCGYVTFRCLDGLYDEWFHCWFSKKDRKAELAKQIAELPWVRKVTEKQSDENQTEE